MIERIFHPIGQGAFYSEHHSDFNVVYDCGNWRNTKKSTSVVKQCFKKDSEIDILFISHFDYDHVSKINILKEQARIKKVVLPLLHDDEITLLTNIYRSLGYDILTLISNPKEFFGKDTVIIKVEPVNNQMEQALEDTDIRGIVDHTTIKSGSRLKISDIDWVYIPYNFEYAERSNVLNNLLIKKNLIVKDIIKPENRKDIKNIYDKLSGGINQNSMLVYSGPINDNNYRKDGYISDTCLSKPMVYNNRAGCIYTGDADLNFSDISIIYKNVWKHVGTIQIPHHGDIKSFKEDIFKDKTYICPISVGLNNLYGHPSTRLKSIIRKNDSIPIEITENRLSEYIELIDLNNNTNLPTWITQAIYTNRIEDILKYKKYLQNTIQKSQKAKVNYETLIVYKNLKQLCNEYDINCIF